MTELEKDLEQKINKIFGTHNLLEKYDIDMDYLEEMFAMSDKLTFKDILFVVNNYESELINSFTKNELLKNELLTKKNVVFRTKEHKLSKEFYKKTIQDIKNKKFNKESVLIIMEIITLINLYGYERFRENKNTFKRYITTNIYSIVRYPYLFGDKIPSLEEKQSLSEKMLNWSNRFGNQLLHNLLNFEILKIRLEDLIEVSPLLYQDELLSLIEFTEKAIKARDDYSIIYDSETKKIINNIFKRYEEINKELIHEIVNEKESEYEFVHFVQTRTVNFQLVGNDVIDVNDVEDNSIENKFNKRQNKSFINNYLEKVVTHIEKNLKTKFSLNDEEHRHILQQYLNYFNDVFNNRPLDRLPINSYEIGQGFKRYVRSNNKRLSTSFVNKDNINSHLDRKVGLVINITSPDAIITTSTGYNSEKEYEVFEEDSASLADLIFHAKESGINETCLDITKCGVKYVMLIGDEPKNVKRAQELAKAYGVKVETFEQKMMLN